MVLGCIRSTPLAILLSEAGMKHPDLIRAELAEQFILRNAQWEGNLINRNISSILRDIHSFSRKINLGKCGVPGAFASAEGVVKMIRTTKLPSFFDLPWD